MLEWLEVVLRGCVGESALSIIIIFTLSSNDPEG